ncbi:MAG: hypothetical protein ACRDQ0_09670, partial [Pseudonocardia sp.]
MMDVVDARSRRVLEEARRRVWGASGWLVVHLVLVGAVGWVAVQDRAVAGVPGEVFWVLAGVLLGEAWSAGESAVEGWWELRRLRRNRVYVTAVADLQDAHDRATRLAGGGADAADETGAG